MEDASWKDRVLKLTKVAQDAALNPVAWAVRVGTDLETFGVELPSPELGVVLVEYLCWGNNVPAVWKFVEKAIDARLAPAVVVLALLSRRVIPVRRSRPAAYRLYLEILKRHTFSFTFKTDDPNYKRIMSSVDDVLHLSETFGGQPCEPGVLIVKYFLHVIWKLLYATLDDEGLLDLTSEIYLKWDKSQDMEIDAPKIFDEKINEHYGKLVKANTVMAIEIIGQYLHHKVISRLLSLAHQNMSSHWEGFSQCLHLLAANSLALQSSSVPPEALFKWSADTRNKLHWQCKPSQYREFCVISSGPLASPGGHCHGSSPSAIWVPLDLYLEDAMDGPVAATNAIEIVSGLLKALQAVNRTTWHDAFLGLWMAALRMVQRERDPIEGPVPHEDTRMCMLLSVTTLSVAEIIGEDEATAINSHESQLKGNAQIGPRRAALISSLQQLGDYESLLTPPPSVISVANQAATKAVVFVSGIPVGSGFNESIGLNNNLKCSGNMRHLIVEACIARNLLDTSAYYWPGYVSGRISQIPHGMSSQVPGWSALMKGAPLTPPLINALMSIPAPSFAELEKVFDMAVNGSDSDRISAATILCGASLIRGWNVQEYTVCLVVKLLSPPIPVGYSGSSSHLIAHAPVLDVVLPGISSVDCVQVFSFHGLVPELAAALMAVCEVFGSCIPKTTWTLSTGEEVSAHTVFSNAFILLLRLWEFNHTPLEYIVMGDGAPVGSLLTPEYLLLLRNISSGGMINKKNSRQLLTNSIKDDLILVDSFPKLKVWYCQHQACLASTLTGLVPGSPVHQNVDSLLAMMFRKANKGSNQTVGSVASGSSSLSSSSITGNEDETPRPKLPAWDIMEAVPYVVDAALTACSHGRVSPRELATGLKDLADFLPASLATIVSYFSSEVTRGIWKPANMNGTDWPSPAANLTMVEENIKKIVAATGADVPSLVKARSSEATLPLPLAAFVSLTITYKLDKGSERFLNLAGPALENLAASCPWPSMPIVASLWTQKVKRWSDFLTFSASRTVFHHNNNALVQLLESCFGATLGFSTTLASGNGGVGRLLGHGFGSHFSGGLSPVAPGILYLRIYRSVRDFIFITEEILSLLIHSVREVANKRLPKEAREKLRKSRNGMRYGQVSLIASLTQVKVAAYLGATLVWLSGGPGIIQCMFREMLPSWFLSMHNSDQGGQNGMVAVLEGYALAYFGVLCGMFAWGMCATPVSKRKYKVISTHLQFIADALDGKISLGCSRATWHAYVSGFLGLVVDCTPGWLQKMELPLLKRLSMGLRLWNEDELAFLLLEKAGPSAMGAAAEFIINT